MKIIVKLIPYQTVTLPVSRPWSIIGAIKNLIGNRFYAEIKRNIRNLIVSFSKIRITISK